MEQIDFKKTIDNLRKTGFNPVPNLVNIAIPDAKNILWQGLNYFTENAEWLPEYEEITGVDFYAMAIVDEGNHLYAGRSFPYF